MKPSDLARQIAGTYLPDEADPKPPVLEWIQAECRTGYFRGPIEKFVHSQPEDFRADLAVVEALDQEKITLRLPCRASDRESPSTFAFEALFELNPLTMAIRRLN